MNAQTPRIARFLVLAVLASAVAVGCSKKVKETPPTDTAPVDTGATTTPIAETPRPGAYSPADLDTDACLRNRVVYFDLDQDALKPEFQAAMACHAKYLRDRPSARLRLEGNADERGSREYNLALGQKRADVVKQALMLLGAKESQIESVSLGEEKPRCEDRTENCYAENRRGDMLYTGEF